MWTSILGEQKLFPREHGFPCYSSQLGLWTPPPMVGQTDDKEYVSPPIIPPRSGNFFPGLAQDCLSRCFVLSRQQPSDCHWSCQVASASWDMPSASPGFPPRMGKMSWEKNHLGWTGRVQAYKCRRLGQLFSSIDQSPIWGSLFSGSFLALSSLRRAQGALRCHKFIFPDGSGESTMISLFPKLKLLILWIVSELIILIQGSLEL